MGNLMVPPLMSRLGRRLTTQAIAFLALIGWFITIMAENVWQLLIGKTFLSLTYGMSLPVRGVMLGEYTSPRYRGALLSTMALGHTSGLLIVHTLGSFFSWQLTALIVTGFQFACIVMTFYYPESPSHLVTIGKYDECKKAYRWLRGENEEDELRKMIEARSVINKQNTEDAARHKPGFKKFMHVVRKPELYKPIILMTHVYLLSQFSGASILASYPMQVLRNLLGPEANLHFWMVFLDALRLFGNALALVVMNRVKRRTIIFSTGVLSIVTQISLASYGYLRYNGLLVYKANWIPLLLINLQMFASAMGLVPTSGVLSGELFPLQYRGIGGSVSLLFISLTLFLDLKTFPTLVESIHLHGSYCIYSFIMVYALIIVWFLMPETKDRTLQDIEDEFRGAPLISTEEDIEKLKK